MLNTLTGLAAQLYQWWLIASWLGIAFSVLAIPFLFFRSTTTWAAGAMIIISYWVYAPTIWFLSFVLTAKYFGWWAIIVGLLFAGIGIFPFALAASVLTEAPGGMEMFWSLLGMLGVMLFFRFTPILAMAWTGRGKDSVE